MARGGGLWGGFHIHGGRQSYRQISENALFVSSCSKTARGSNGFKTGYRSAQANLMQERAKGVGCG